MPRKRPEEDEIMLTENKIDARMNLDSIIHDGNLTR